MCTILFTAHRFVHSSPFCSLHIVLFTLHRFVHCSPSYSLFTFLFTLRRFVHCTLFCSLFAVLFTLRRFVHSSPFYPLFTVLFTLHRFCSLHIVLFILTVLFTAHCFVHCSQFCLLVHRFARVFTDVYDCVLFHVSFSGSQPCCQVCSNSVVGEELSEQVHRLLAADGKCSPVPCFPASSDVGVSHPFLCEDIITWPPTVVNIS